MFRIILSMLIAPILLTTGCTSSGSDEKKEQSTAVAPGASPAALMSPAVSPKARAADPVYAYVDAIRGDLSDGKVQIINQVMRLTPEESKTFWPIYHDYEEELFQLGDQRVELTRNFLTAQEGQGGQGGLDNDRAAKLTDDWFAFENQRLQLLQKYQKLISAQLSPVRAAQFAQIEHRVGTVMDLVIASELPLVRGASSKTR